MKHKLGRMGVTEAACVAATAMCTNGLFCIDGRYAYSFGNTTYMSIPLASLVSFFLLLPIIGSMRRRGAESLWELYSCSYGKLLGIPAAVLTGAALILCAVIPLQNFEQIIHESVFIGADRQMLAVFMLPSVILLACMGFETMGRTAKCYALLLVLSLAVLIALSFKRQQTYRLYPPGGEDAARFIGFSASECVWFFSPLIALLICGRGLNGLRGVRSAGAIAALVSSVICAAVQLMLARVYTYSALTKLFMPLCRVSYLNTERNYIMGLDKLLIMLWLNGAFITAAFCIYSAALLLAQSFDQRDVQPAVIMLSAVICGVMFRTTAKEFSAFEKLKNVFFRYGAAAALLPPFGAAVLSVGKEMKKEC